MSNPRPSPREMFFAERVRGRANGAENVIFRWLWEFISRNHYFEERISAIPPLSKNLFFDRLRAAACAAALAYGEAVTPFLKHSPQF